MIQTETHTLDDAATGSTGLPLAGACLNFDCRHGYGSGFTLEARFTMGPGVTALVGPSGSGKSTVLSLIAGLIRPKFGRLSLGGRCVLDTEARRWVPPQRRGVGLVVQDHALFPHMSVRGNLLYGQRRRGSRGPSSQAERPDLAWVCRVLELGDLLGRRPGTLSGGQRQRVALGRALLQGPELLLLDEPLSALDEGLKGRIIEDLRRVLRAWAVPTLMVSHNVQEVRALAGRVIRMDQGRIMT